MGSPSEWKQHIDIAVNNFESGCVENRTFEPGILIAADDEGIEFVGRHPGADVFVAAVDFVLTWQVCSERYDCTL